MPTSVFIIVLGILMHQLSWHYEELRTSLKVEQDGYVQVGNESDTDVFFDDVQLDYQPGLLVQENHYDPWGLN